MPTKTPKINNKRFFIFLLFKSIQRLGIDFSAQKLINKWEVFLNEWILNGFCRYVGS